MSWLSDLGNTVGGFFGMDNLGDTVGNLFGGGSGGDSGGSWWPSSGSIGDVLGSVSSGIGDMFSGIVPGITSAFEGLGSSLGSVFENLSGGIGSVFSGIKDALPDMDSLWSGVKDVMGSTNSAAAAAGLATYLGTQETNQTNRDLAGQLNSFNAAQAQANRDFTSNEASRQMAFQERMANTVHQRAVSDLRAAGLNPMLAALRGGNPSPGGAAGGGSSASGAMPTIANALGSGVSSAFAAQNAFATLDRMKAETANIRSQTAINNAQVFKVEADTAVSKGSAAKIDQEIKNLVVEFQRLDYAQQKAYHEVDSAKSEAERNRIYVKEVLPLVIRQSQISNQLLAYEVPGARASAKSWETGFGQTVRPWLRDIFGGARAAGGLGLKFDR